MRDRRDAQDRAKLIPFYFLVASLVVHVLAFIILPTIRFPEYQASKEDIVEIDPALLDAIDPQQLKQIVESERAANTEAPDEAKYLGERNQKVEKETKAARVDSFKAGQSAPAKQLTMKNLAPAPTFSKPMLEGDEQLVHKQALQEPQQQKTGQAASTNDYLKDTEDGNRTLLNTKEFMYFGYYHRIRQRLEQSWNANLRSVLTAYMRSGRRLANEKDYVTRIVVVLDRNGKIRAVKVLEESGARDLDDAAVEAFNRAGPFPNPPKGLVDAEGLIKIRWDFILQS